MKLALAALLALAAGLAPAQLPHPTALLGTGITSHWILPSGGGGATCYQHNGMTGNNIYGPCASAYHFQDTAAICLLASQEFCAAGVLNESGSVSGMAGTTPTRTATCHWRCNGFTTDGIMQESAGP